MTGNEFKMIRRFLGYNQEEFSTVIGSSLWKIGSAEAIRKRNIPPSLEYALRKHLDPEEILKEITHLKKIPRKERMYEFDVRRLVRNIERRNSKLPSRSDTIH